ncbi:uncharacterized protein LOC132785602 [Drosophila nasuta]|uniref:uncharacterized protein LOC132785602 n=1 Tax=Drosophila nasuta TaxID=42062 RepID=UPI00295F3532|nr:uncharacterized protein LOC132785602 [Drosophila nasuta]
MGNHKVLKTAGINLRYSMYDFIDAVKKQDIIWDREHENFHNRELRDQAWQQIGLQMCKNFEDASVGEKQEIAKTLLKRWKNTRDSYLRVNRVRQSGEEISRGSYIYEKELSFLLDVKAEHDEIGAFKVDRKTAVKRTHLRMIKTPQKRRRESENQERSSDVVDMGVSIDASIQQNALLEDGLNTTMETLNCTTNTSTLLPPTQQNFKNESISAIFGANSTAVNTSTNCIDPDPDQAFFDSIKPDMQRMTSDQKLEFKIEVLKILRNFKILPN